MKCGIDLHAMRWAIVKVPHRKFQENPSSGGRAGTWGQTEPDRQDEASYGLIATSGNAPKNFYAVRMPYSIASGNYATLLN
jgi:hypothetical protein